MSTETSDGQAVLTVTNTGPVVPTSEIDRLFRPFQRLDPRRTHYQSGHGLGLSIARAVATTHHAAITARPQPEGGLAVTVTFPSLASSGTSPKRPSRSRRFATSQP